MQAPGLQVSGLGSDQVLRADGLMARSAAPGLSILSHWLTEALA